jgi:N-acetylmuramoyl-L-alanine amidase
MMAVLGPCAKLAATTTVEINEATTIGAVYALAPYMQSYSAVASNTTDAQMMADAFSTAAELASAATGGTPGSDVPAGHFVPSQKLNTLANILSACINSSDGKVCGLLFSLASAGSKGAPSDTVGALLDIAQNPTTNVAAIFNLEPPMQPFQPSLNSAPTDWTLRITSPTPSPAVFPAPGMYVIPPSVTLSDSNPSAVIYYTLDGSQPTSSSIPYTGAIALSGTTTIRSLAIAGGISSLLAAGTFVLEAPANALTTSGAALTSSQTQALASNTAFSWPLASTKAGAPTAASAPAFSTPGGIYTAAQSVTLSSATAGAIIRYTTNGSTPSVASTLYAGPIIVSSTEMLEAIAILPGNVVSPVASAAYIINLPGSTPKASTAARPATRRASARANTQTSTQTTVTISNSVATAGIDRPGINLGGIGGYGSQQLLKSLNYVNGGYFPGTYAATTYSCSQGGANTTTSWYNNITDASGYPASFWAGATFVAINSATGTSYGSGSVTASTANTGSTGITFTLSPAISAPCNPSQNDVLIVRLTQSNTLVSPYQVLNGHICTTATWNTTDTSPASANTQQSLEMPSGCGLTFYIDATVTNRTNTNAALASQQANFINLNGSYDATFKAKCVSSGCSVNFSLGRLGGTTFVASTTVSPSFGTSPGTGWTTYSYPFTASETGLQNQTVGYTFTCTGTCLLQDADLMEGSTLPGNTTVFRDAVVYELQKIHPGSIRYMDASQWCSDVADEIATSGNRRWCGVSNYTPGVGQPLGYNDVLALGNFLGSDVLISVGALNQPSDWTTLIKWLNSSGWISTFANTGHTIYLEDGNEAWNSGVGGTLYMGNGLAYGYTLGPNMAAARAAAGYNSKVIKLVGNTWVAGSQGYGPFGWIHNSLGIAQNTPNGLPDFVDDAPYTLNYLGSFDTSGSNVATTGAPFLDEWAEDANIDSVTSPPLYSESMYLNQQYAKANFGVNTLVYEVNESTNSGVAATQSQLNQIDASVGNALAITQHVLLMQRDSQVTGPIHVFTLAEPYTGYGCNGGGCVAGAVMPLWGTTLFMATGPGQSPGVANADRPLAIALEVINNAIGSNGNLMSIKQTGTPTFSYPGGQVQGSSNSISPNNAVPYVNCFSFSNGASAWTTICFNNNLTTAESVTLAGAGAPTGSVSETVFPGPSNLITDNNENTYLGASSIAPVVTLPSPTTTSGTSYSIPPASMIALTYSIGGTTPPNTLSAPTFSPATGTYSGTQTVTVSFPAGSSGCVGINSIPTAAIPGTCGSGGTIYTGPITVSNTETVNAIATEIGDANSVIASATYTITTPTASTPSFSPGGGTYTGAQSVTISASSGTTIYYTTNGTAPTTSSSLYSGPIAVSASTTIEAIAVETGYNTSPVATAAYIISPVVTSLVPAVSTSCYQGSGSSSLTMGPINTTGASAIAIAVASFKGISSVTDNLGNGSATGLTATSGGSPNNQLFYWQTPNVGSAHTFTVNGSSGLYASACVFVMSGISGTYSGVQSANSAGYGSSSCQAGSIAPASGPQIVITGFGVYTPIGVPNLDSSFTVGAYQAGAGGSAFGEAAGYIIQSSGTATNPKWNWSNAASTPSCVIAAFGGVAGVPTAASPSFSPGGGTYTGAQSVTISASSGTTIYYTTNGTAPTTSSSVYRGPIAVSASATIEAIAVETGYNTSPVATAAYIISPVVTSLAPAVSTSCYQGSGSSSLTMGPINTTGASAIAIAVASFNDISSVTDNLGNGSATGLTATSGGNPNNQLFYWQTPNVGSAHTFTVNGGSGLYASACVFVMSGISGTYSGVQSANSAGYGSSSCQAGSIAPASGPQIVITGFGVYTPIGVPTLDSSFTVGAYQAGAGGSAFGEATGYIIQSSGTATNPKWNWSNAASTPSCVIAAFGGVPGVPTAATPSFSPRGGTYTGSQSVTISASSGTTIYYTTNGTTPTTSSSVYRGPIAVSASATIEAIAVETGYNTSPVATAAYIISPVVTSLAPAVSTSCYQGSGSSSLTMGPINTTGASAIAIAVASFNDISSVTDNLGNGSATGLTATSGSSPHNQLFYWQTPNVGSAHTFTVNGGSGLYASACVFVMSGISGTFGGVQSANSAGYGSSSCQAGSIEPANGPQIVITGFGVYTPIGVPTLDSSFTVGAYQAGAGGSAFGEAAGYIIQSSGTVTNPKWNWSNAASTPSCVIAAFGGVRR